MITIKTGTLDPQKGFEGLPEFDNRTVEGNIIRYYKNSDIVAITKTETYNSLVYMYYIEVITSYTMIVFESPSFSEGDIAGVIGFLDEVLDYLY